MNKFLGFAFPTDKFLVVFFNEDYLVFEVRAVR